MLNKPNVIFIQRDWKEELTNSAIYEKMRQCGVKLNGHTIIDDFYNEGNDAINALVGPEGMSVSDEVAEKLHNIFMVSDNRIVWMDGDFHFLLKPTGTAMNLNYLTVEISEDENFDTVVTVKDEFGNTIDTMK